MSACLHALTKDNNNNRDDDDVDAEDEDETDAIAEAEAEAKAVEDVGCQRWFLCQCMRVFVCISHLALVIENKQRNCKFVWATQNAGDK